MGNDSSIDLSIFTVFGGREWTYAKFLLHLQSLRCNPKTTELVWYDNSFSPEFGKMLYASAVTYRELNFPPENIRIIPTDGDIPFGERSLHYQLMRIYWRLPKFCRGKYIMTLEDDVYPPTNTITGLLGCMRANNADIVTAAVPSRSRKPHRGGKQTKFLVGAWKLNGDHFRAYPRKPVPVRGSGWNCMIMKRNVFERMKLPPAKPRPRGIFGADKLFGIAANVAKLNYIICPYIRCEHQLNRGTIANFELNPYDVRRAREECATFRDRRKKKKKAKRKKK